MMILKKFVFIFILLTASIAHAMEETEERWGATSVPSFNRLSKIAALYVNTWNNFNTETSPEVLTKIFQKLHSDKELESLNDLDYSIINCLPSYTMDWAEKAHIPFLDNFLKLEDIEKIPQAEIRKSLMLMAHDIGVAKAVRTFPERKAILEQIKHTVGKLYLVMFHRERLEREVVGIGSGTFVQNEEHKKSFVLSCAHFPTSMGKYDSTYSFEIYFFPHYLLDQKTFPLGTEGPKISFDQYQDLRVNSVIFPSDAQVTLGNTPSEKHEFLESDISNIRVVKEGKKDFACFLEMPRPQMIPMSFESFGEHSKSSEFLAAGYPAWGLSDNTFAIVKGQRWTAKKLEKNQEPFTFPTLHGMSGGPVFVRDEKESKFVLISILTGVEKNTLQSVSYPLSGSDVAFLEDIK